MKQGSRVLNYFRMVTMCIIATAFAAPNALADSAEDLAQKLTNPIEAMISVPFQANYDTDIGAQDTGDRFLMNIQPVIPISLNEDWNIIARTILPVVSQRDIFSDAGSQTGLGDTSQSLIFSPKKPTDNGWIWGTGAIFLLPTATDDLLGGDKWGAGPTAIALKLDGPWTYGALVNHIWSVAGDSDRPDISGTLLQPFLSYTTRSAVSFTLVSESTYDWKSSQWAVPINAVVAKVVKLGSQIVSVGGGVRYWAESTDNGPEGWGGRLVVTFLFPK